MNERNAMFFKTTHQDIGIRPKSSRSAGLVESKCPLDTGFSDARIDGRANRDWQLPVHLRDRFPFRATI